MISFDTSICGYFDEASSREWLETNGIGGYASGTISGANSRRYHGLLTAATKPPLGRIRMLSKFEETVVIDGVRTELSSNQYPGAVHPQGFLRLISFRLDPFPVWAFEIDGLRIEKTVFMIHGRNATAFEWRVSNADPKDPREIKLELRPLLSFVDYHHLQHENGDFGRDIEQSEGTVSIRPYRDAPSLVLDHNAAEVEASGFWYRDLEYAIERERGFDFNEDLFQPFVLNFDLTNPATVIASADDRPFETISVLKAAEIERREKLVKIADPKDDLTRELVLAADQFIVKRGDGHTIIAGYPWFSDWGRDTMIALNGLTLATNRPAIARDILLEFSRHISQGMIPNRFPDQGDTADYNTVDATLWYFEAIRAYLATTGDIAFIKDDLYEKLCDIIDWHLRGTRFDIHVDTDGLLHAGENSTQLTWMDAKIGDLVITPRIGKPVEIQALWYNALRISADIARRCGDGRSEQRFGAIAELCRQSFNAIFWNEKSQCLFDVVESGHRDDSIRPNQVFAVSLPYSMLDDESSRKVVDRVAADLLTPFGLRSLSPNDQRYCAIYIGSPLERDSAYHQGTVWAWLIGGFVDAYRRVYPERESDVAAMLSGFKKHLMEAGIGQVSEIFDAEHPHKPRGCFAQAWSVAELLRVSVRD